MTVVTVSNVFNLLCNDFWYKLNVDILNGLFDLPSEYYANPDTIDEMKINSSATCWMAKQVWLNDRLLIKKCTDFPKGIIWFCEWQSAFANSAIYQVTL